MDKILHYLVIIFATGLFSVIYFAMLKSGMKKVLQRSRELNYVEMNYLYGSFLLRFFLAGVFFFFILKYYKRLDEIILVVATFVFIRYLEIKFEKSKIKKGNNNQ